MVGALFFGALATVAYFTIITEGGPLQKKLPMLRVYFPNAQGIKVGNKVTVQGVPYGYVSSVQLVKLDADGNVLSDDQAGIFTKVQIAIALRNKIHLFENYKISIRNESLLSGRVIAIDPGTAYELDTKTGEIKKGAVVRKPLALDFSPTQKATKVNLRGKTDQDPLVSLSELIAENRNDIRKTVANIADITGKINQGDGTLGKLINSGSVHDNVNTALTDAQIVLRELREGLEDTREQAPVTSFIRAALSAF
ncbi:MAG: MlaD family protein [Spirochaetota bacterium]